MLCFCWDIKEIVHYEMLNNNQKFTANLYSDKLRRLKTVLNQMQPSLVNRNGVIHYDNTRSHTAWLGSTALSTF